MALAVIGAAMYLEIQGKGLTPTMAGFLVGIVGLFSAANYATSNAFMASKKGASDPDLHEKVDDLHEVMKDAMAPEKSDDLKQLLVNINTTLTQVQGISGQTGQAVLNLTQVLNSLRK